MNKTIKKILFTLVTIPALSSLVCITYTAWVAMLTSQGMIIIDFNHYGEGWWETGVMTLSCTIFFYWLIVSLYDRFVTKKKNMNDIIDVL